MQAQTNVTMEKRPVSTGLFSIVSVITTKCEIIHKIVRYASLLKDLTTACVFSEILYQ